MNNKIDSKGQEIPPKKFPVQTRKLAPIAPTVLIAIAVIVLTIIPKSHIIKLQLQNDQFVLITDFEKDVTFLPIKDVSIKCINITNFKSVKIGYKNLFEIINGKTQPIAQNGTAEIIPQLADYELKFFWRDIKINSLEIGGESLISIRLECSDGNPKLLLEIERFPSILRLQFSDSVNVIIKRCIINYSDGEKVDQIKGMDQQQFLFIPSDVSSISPISGTDNVLKLKIDITKEVFNSIFESEISLKMIGFIDSDISSEPDRILKAKCKKLQIDDSQKDAYHDQFVFLKQEDLNRLKLEGINLLQDEMGKINLNFSGYMKKFNIGLHEDLLRNIMPSYLEWLSKSSWAIVAAILAWLITSSLLAYDIYYRRKT